MTRERGFSLLEVLAALALLALLLLAVYSGVSGATHSVRSGNQAIERMEQVRSAQQFLRRELGEATALPWAIDAQDMPVTFTGDAHEMRYVAPLPGYLGRMGPQLQILRLVDDGQGTWRLEVSFAMLPPDASEPRPLGEPEVLLSGITEGRFRYVAQDDSYVKSDWLDQWSYPSRLPALVRIEISAGTGSGHWPELDVPIHQGPAAINVRALAIPLMARSQP